MHRAPQLSLSIHVPHRNPSSSLHAGDEEGIPAQLRNGGGGKQELRDCGLSHGRGAVDKQSVAVAGAGPETGARSILTGANG